MEQWWAVYEGSQSFMPKAPLALEELLAGEAEATAPALAAPEAYCCPSAVLCRPAWQRGRQGSARQAAANRCL